MTTAAEPDRAEVAAFAAQMWRHWTSGLYVTPDCPACDQVRELGREQYLAMVEPAEHTGPTWARYFAVMAALVTEFGPCRCGHRRTVLDGRRDGIDWYLRGRT